MANSKISQLTAATTPLAGTEVVPLVQSSTTKKVAVSDLTAGRDTSFKTGTATPRNGAIPTSNSVLTGLTIFNDQDSATGDGVALFLDHSYRTPGAQTRGIKFSSYSTTTFAGYVGAKIQVTSSGSFLESVDFNDNGNIKFSTGNLIQGTAAKGINFTANTGAAGKTSQLLNWYEEGTWTPAIGGQASGSATLSVAFGNYTRIGRQVTVKGRINFSASTLSGGSILISGLPFTSENTSNSLSVGTMILENVTYTGQSFSLINSNSSVIYFFSSSSGSNASSLAGGAFGATSTATFSITYFV